MGRLPHYTRHAGKPLWPLIGSGQIFCALLIALFSYHPVANTFKSNLANLSILQFLSSAAVDPALPTSPDASTFLQGVVEYQASAWAEARKHFQTSLSTHGDVARWYLLQSALKQDDWPYVLDQLDVAVETDWPLFVRIVAEYEQAMSDAQRSHYMGFISSNDALGAAYLHQKLSQREFDEVITVAPSFANYATSAHLQLMVGRAYFYQHNFEQAITVLRNAHQLNPNLHSTIWLGKALFNHGEQIEGLQYMEAILREPVDHRHIPYLIDLSIAYAVVGNCSNAQEVWNTAHATDIRAKQVDAITRAQQTILTHCHNELVSE